LTALHGFHGRCRDTPDTDCTLHFSERWDLDNVLDDLSRTQAFLQRETHALN